LRGRSDRAPDAQDRKANPSRIRHGRLLRNCAR
jgi:hypothetical protein